MWTYYFQGYEGGKSLLIKDSSIGWEDVPPTHIKEPAKLTLVYVKTAAAKAPTAEAPTTPKKQ